MSEVNGYMNIVALMDGTTINGRIRVDGAPLAQRYTKGSTTYIPDWSGVDKSKNPVLVVILRDASSGEVLPVSSITWKYNNLALTFDSNGYSNNNDVVKNLFKKGTKNVTIDGKEYTVPSLLVNDNLVSTSNVDNDLITCSGQVLAEGNNYIDFSELVQEVLIEESTSSQLDVVIVSDSDFSIDSKDDFLTLSANVYVAGSLDETTEYAFKWYSIIASGSELLGSSKTQKITETMVDSTMKIRCDVISNGNVIGSGFTEVTDYSDPYYVRFDISGIDGNIIKSGQTAIVSPKAIARTSGNEASVASWNWRFTDNNGNDYAIGDSSTLSAKQASISFDNVRGASKGLNIYVSTSIE